jgi:hypothetical protein
MHFKKDILSQRLDHLFMRIGNTNALLYCQSQTIGFIYFLTNRVFDRSRTCRIRNQYTGIKL